MVIATGGLGPTQDDITREGLAEALGVPLVRHREIEDFLRDRYARLRAGDAGGRTSSRPMSRRAARYILPQRGTAPGLAVETAGGKRVYVVAGVPAEMREMMTGHHPARAGRPAGPAALVSRTIRVTGIPECQVAEVLDDLFRASSNPSRGLSGVLRRGKDPPHREGAVPGEAEALIDPLAAEVPPAGRARVHRGR